MLAMLCSALLAGRLAAEMPASDVVELQNHERISLSAYQAGRSEADKDVRENRLIIEIFGLPTPWDGEYAKLLNDRYHIQVRRVAGCIVDEKLVGHAKGYNEISESEIQHRFGGDVLEKTQSEVKRHWEETNAK